MARVTPPPLDQQQNNQAEATAVTAISPTDSPGHQKAGQPLPLWPQLIDKWLHNPIILLTLLIAFLATLASLVLIAGLVGASLAALLAAGTLPVAWKARNHMRRARTPELESTQTVLNEISNNEPH